MAWLNEVFPDNEQWQKFSNGVISVTGKMRDSIEIDPRLKQLGEEKMSEWRKWFDTRLDNAIEAAEVEAQLEGVESTKLGSPQILF